jgi:hypothetical protein
MSRSIDVKNDLPEASPGDFGAVVRDDRILLPKNVGEAAGKLSLRNAEELVSYAQAFPSAVASALNWPAESVAPAARRLAESLKLPAEPTSRPARAYGALDPTTRPD